MLFLTLFKILFTVILIVAVIVFTIIPAPVKFIISRLLRPTDYPLDTSAREFGKVTLYSDRKYDTAIVSTPMRRLLVWFHGGAFMFSNRRNSYGLLNRLYARIKSEYDIVVFDYPVRFSNTIHDTMLSINRTLSQFIGKYDEFYCGGLSAGTLLMGAFMKKEADPHVASAIQVPVIGMKFYGAIGVCGLYDTQFDSSLLNSAFDFYIMRNTPKPHLYSCYNSGVPFLVLGAVADYLYPHTHRFVLTEPSEYFIYNNPNLPHTFPLLNNLVESKDCVRRISEFLMKKN